MVTMCKRFNLLIFIAVILHVGLILTSKHEMLKSAIQSSQFKRDVKFDKNSVTCLKCKVLISTESSNHFSNVLRHFNSESHKFKTQWCVKDDSVKNILSVVSLKQKSTLLTFFGGKMKDKKTQSQVPNAPIPVSNTKLQCEIDRESEITIKELQLKEKLLQQNTEMNKCKANELCYVFQKDYQENKKDEGNDMQNMRFYMETLATNIEKHITCKEDLMLNEIETKKTILLQIEKFKYQQISYTVNAIELSDDMKNINLKFLQDFIGDKLAIFSSILDKKRFFQERFTTTELIKSLEEKGPDPNSPDTDVYIKFSVLLQKENCLSDFLGDILQNMNKRRPIWSESTVNLYSLLLNYGGPVAVDLMRRNLGGPSLSRVYLQARQTIPIETSLTETSFRNAAEFYKKVCKDVDIKSIIFTIAVDATPVLPLIRAKGNKLLGFATNKDIIVQSAEDVIQVFKDDSLLRAQQTYVFALVPLRSDIPYCILAAPPVVKGENQGTALNWLIKSKEWGQQYNLNIYGLGADGDSKIRSFYVHRYLKNHGCNDFTIDRQDFTFSLPQNQFDSIDCPFPDPRHLLKKWRNQLLNIRRLLIMGDHLVQLEHLMELADIEEIKHTLGLWKTDIRVNDKQNVNAAIRLFNPNVQSHLKEYGGDKYAGTIVYLHLGQILNEIYFNKELSIRKRIKFSWTLVQFCRLWKTCIVLSKYKTDKTFISDQTYNDVIIAGHSIILMTKLHFLHHKNQPFEPWTWGSNSCEDIFSKSRCFIRTKNNFCYAEFLDICRRIQKVTETESDFNKPSKKQVFLGINLTTDINILIEEEMRHGDIYAKELLEKTEMHTLLQKAGIIDENNKIDISTWSNKQQIYHSDIDELEDLSQDELLSLNDEEILFTVVANDVELLHSADLLDMACDDIVDHAKDEELNLNGSEQSSNSEMHAPLPDGPVALSTSLTETHQTTGQNEQVIQEKETRKNTHIFYKGNWYHISQFVSWEQGKFYMPKQSRLNRFYSNYAIFDKFLPPESLLNQDKHLTRGDFIATWNNGIFCFGKLMRIVKPSVKGKCAHPQFIWKKSNEGAATTDFAIQILRSTNKQQETVPGSLIITKTFKWVSSAEFVLKLILQPKDGYFIMDSSCRQQLIDAITYLQENDKKEEKRQREDKKRKFDEKKSGPPEKMTVQILKSLLKENGVRFTSKDKKADLVKLVKEKISSSNPSREIPSQCESEMEQRHKKRDIGESAQHVKKKKIKTIMIKRTIFFTFYSIPFDYSKHYLYTIYLHFLEILLILFGVHFHIHYMLTVFYILLSILWEYILRNHLIWLARPQAECYNIV